MEIKPLVWHRLGNTLVADAAWGGQYWITTEDGKVSLTFDGDCEEDFDFLEDAVRAAQWDHEFYIKYFLED